MVRLHLVNNFNGMQRWGQWEKRIYMKPSLRMICGGGKCECSMTNVMSPPFGGTLPLDSKWNLNNWMSQTLLKWFELFKCKIDVCFSSSKLYSLEIFYCAVVFPDTERYLSFMDFFCCMDVLFFFLFFQPNYGLLEESSHNGHPHSLVFCWHLVDTLRFSFPGCLHCFKWLAELTNTA